MYPSLPVILLTLAAPTSPECGTELNELLHAKQFRAAASRAERCWGETRAIEDLGLAIQARVSLGHGAHAAHDLREYAAANDAKPDDVRFFQEDIRPLVVTVEIALVNALAEDAQLRAVFQDDPRRGALLIDYASLPATVTQGRELALDPGTWKIELQLGDDIVASQVIVAASGLQVSLEAPVTPEPEPEPLPGPIVEDTPRPSVDRRRLGVSIGLGVASGSMLAGGLVLFSKQGPMSSTKEELLQNEVNRAWEVWHGSVLVGAGLGGTAVAVTEAARAPRSAFYAELGIGGAIGLGGLIGTAVHVRSYKRQTATDFEDRTDIPGSYFDAHIPKEVATGLLLGLGTGLATGAAVALVTRAITKRRRGSGAQTARRRQ